jgi:ribosomal protein S18 acetylase RimI-like enzyme
MDEQNIVYKRPDEDEIQNARSLIIEYIKWLNQDLSFQNIDEELNNFPQKYSEPDGIFIIAKENSNVVGCVGLKKIDGKICEMKRLFVNNNHRGKGIGRKLIDIIIEEAKLKGYEIIRLDTLATMESALRLYGKSGFYEISPYYNNPYSGVVYLEKKL